MRDQSLDQGALGTNAPGSALVDRAQVKQAYSLVFHAITLGDIIDLRVQPEVSAIGSLFPTGALLDQFGHLADGYKFVQQL